MHYKHVYKSTSWEARTSKRVIANSGDARCGYSNLNSLEARHIVDEVETLLNKHNEVQSDNQAIVLNPAKTPARKLMRRFNAPIVDDVAGIMIRDRTAIVIRTRNNNLETCTQS